jgi:hypothetical protein
MCPLTCASTDMQDASEEQTFSYNGAAYRDSALRGGRHSITRELLGFAISTWGKQWSDVKEPPEVEETEFDFCYSRHSHGPTEHEYFAPANASTGTAFPESGEAASGQSTNSWWAAPQRDKSPTHSHNASSDGAVTDNVQGQPGAGDGDMGTSVTKPVAGNGLQRSDFVQVMSTNRERLVATTQGMRKVCQP